MMDWTQASVFEQAVFASGLLAIGLLSMAVISVILYTVGCWVVDRFRRIKRKRKTTAALKCEICEYNVEDENCRRCERFGLNISTAPVRIPGCSWGKERKAKR